MSEEEQAVLNADQETFKRWIKEYDALTTEIKEAGAILSQMRKKKRVLEESQILPWMQHNNVANVKLRGNEVLQRNIKTAQRPVNADHINTILTAALGNDDLAAQYTSMIYSERPEEEKEILKIVDTAPKKRKVRPVQV